MRRLPGADCERSKYFKGSAGEGTPRLMTLGLTIWDGVQSNSRTSLTFLLIAWFSPAEEAKRPICSGFLRFARERKRGYTNRPETGPTEECEQSVPVNDRGA